MHYWRIENERHSRLLYLLTGILVVITLGTAGYSLLDSSVYSPSTPDELLPGAMSQDLISVAAAVALLICTVFVRRGREAAWPVWAGLVGYLFYGYSLYCFDRVYNPLFICYIAILGISVYSLILFFRFAALHEIDTSKGPEPPRKSTAFFLLLLAAMFLVLWLSILIPAMMDRMPPDGNAIFVLDLSFILPLLAIEAVLLLRKRPLGDGLAVPVLIKMSTLGISVMTGALLAPLFSGTIDPPSVAIYGLLGLGPLFFATRFQSLMKGELTRFM